MDFVPLEWTPDVGLAEGSKRHAATVVFWMLLASGSMFAGYTILRLLGSGGMAEVYLAQHP